MRIRYTETGIDWFRRTIPEIIEQSTGLKILDNFLGRGFGPGNFVEFDGASGSGKTEFCMTVIAEAFRKRHKDYVYYIDYTGGFSPHRLREVLKNRLDPITDEDVDDYLKRIIYINIQDEDSMHQFLLNFTEITEHRSISLLVIENIGLILSGTVRSLDHFIQRGKWKQTSIRSLIATIANRHSFPVIFTNHIRGWQEKMSPALGEVWANSIKHHVLLHQEEGAFFIQNFNEKLKPTSAVFKFSITEKGVTDFELN